MTDQDRRKLLQELQEQIEQTKPLDEKGRELLRRLDKEIHELLENPEDDLLEAPAALIKRMNENIEHFEQTHPTLTMALSQMMTVLSNAGI
ncbi:MAG: DUF4404 family protein [Anaerolineae bacterium]|nr:DUF4404 family protein [Anaerolineae bacterium]MCI0607938.1 DUF4404 family protein [Anaerolineae bacterium]